MFERFTDRARQAVVHAQHEARELGHNYIGTEHLLLGLLDEPEGLAARALQAAGITAAALRAEVQSRIGRGKGTPTGHIPFTPRAKKVLELSLREALQLGHSYIGTEHILLGLIREGEGVAAVVLGDQSSAGVAALRETITQMVPPAGAGAREGRLSRLFGRPTGRGTAGPAADQPAAPVTPAVAQSLSEAQRLAGEQRVASHHLLLALLADADSAAVRTLTGLGVDVAAAREALRGVDIAGSSDEPPEEAGRRTMVLVLERNRLLLASTDQTLLGKARAAFGALATAGATGTRGATGDRWAAGGPADTEAARAASPEPAGPASGMVRGDHPAATGLGAVWQALGAALEDLGSRAAAAEAGAAGETGETGPGAPGAAGGGEQGPDQAGPEGSTG